MFLRHCFVHYRSPRTALCLLVDLGKGGEESLVART